jgi:signal transduction histidine kinase
VHVDGNARSQRVHTAVLRVWRARPDAQGTGLGLPIAGQIAQAHGGDLTVLSPGPDGDGTAFTLTLRR